MEPYNDELCFDSRLRSICSNEKAYVRFVNVTSRTVEIKWVNFTGEYVRYQLLRRASFFDINTYKTHPWIAVDVHTGDRMHIDKQFVYMPKPYREHLLENPCLVCPVVTAERRKVVRVTLPLHSLRYTALLVLRQFFKTSHEAGSLDLPKPLLDDLKRVIDVRNRYRQ